MADPRPPHPPAAHPRPRGERGSASLELAVVFPDVLALVFLNERVGIYVHARTLALTAAQEGLRAASALTGSTGDATGPVERPTGKAPSMTPRALLLAATTPPGQASRQRQVQGPLPPQPTTPPAAPAAVWAGGSAR